MCVADLVVGVAGATTSCGPLFTADISGLVAGAVSMALGEYVSVSTQRDPERVLLARDERELTDHDALAAHLDVELHLDPDRLANPVPGRCRFGLSFTVTALLSRLTILLPPSQWRYRSR